MKKQSSLNRQIAGEAAGWAVAIDGGDLTADQRAALLRWLKASPAHLDEFLMALSLLEGAGFSDPGKSVDVSGLIRQAAGAEASAIPLRGGALMEEGVEAPWPHVRRHWWAGAIAASLTLVVAAAFYLLEQGTGRTLDPAPLVVATALGEQRSVTLADGSIVYVNTQSRITVDYGDDFRTVEVEEGEALFEVAKDPNRPFRVTAGETVAEALGTKFNVRFIGDQAEVSVIEGTVAFKKRGLAFAALDRPTAGSSHSRMDQVGRLEAGRVILVAGERADLSPSAVRPTVAYADADAVAAWKGRRLIFKDEPLGAVADEFNRYNRKKLRVTNEKISMQRISGVFASDDPDSLAEFLELTSDVTVQREVGEIRIESAIAQ